MRPWEVRHLVAHVPRGMLPFGHSFVGSVAAWIQMQLQIGELAYFPDPPHYDRWCPPSKTLHVGGGDCDDFAILAVSILRAGGVEASVIAGKLHEGGRAGGHAWVEGYDERGWFLLEATQGVLVRGARPPAYELELVLAPDYCLAA